MKSITLLILLAISTNLFSQQTTADQKSKNQKKVALIMLGGGTTFLLTGILIPKGEVTHVGFLGNDYENDGVKGVFQLTGIVSMLGSIPFFIASSKNKKRATSLSLKNETTPQIQKNSFVYRAFPSLSLKIQL